MHLSEYAKFDGLGLAELVRRREVKPQELVEIALAAIQAVNPSLNAVIDVLEKEARTTLERGLPEGPFTGLPFLFKDLVMHAAGIPSDSGSRLFQGLVLPHDTALMGRYRKAGLVPLGRTNTPELGFNATTEPVLHGATQNPWNPEYSPGGSSGGSAAAVSSGMVPLAYANDGGGSIRIPASLCGLFGLKPTRGRTPSGPDVGEPLNGMGVEHILSRTVRDSAAMLDATMGPDVGAPFHIAPPERPYLEEVKREPGRLRIAFTRASPASRVAVSPECVAAVEDVARLCQDLGHEVVEARPDYVHEVMEEALLAIWSSGLAGWAFGLAGMTGRKPGPDTLEAANWATLQHGLGLKSLEMQRAFAIVNRVTRAVASFFVEHDVLLTPTMPFAPYRLGVLKANEPTTAQEWASRTFSYCAFTGLFNVTGQPAMNVPLHWSAEGMPVGTQFAGRWGDEATLFRLAGQLERARPWAQRLPRIHVSTAR
ncbi:amidase [Hyalangium rubrum]|uniref:Amidase n=1 Tax=Hyalangium rubrum TaxID=3103134 RepID=A0ABU5HHZ6_9BACT|nr:amidase [Hyalangium sp. s54d21]MDY7231700.1 amidase [Hyalangium sp. s54d21]